VKAAVAPLPDRLAELEKLAIHHGSHNKFEQGHCAMELVAWLANEPHSDRPACACPVVSRFIVDWNDRMRTDEDRAFALRPLLPLIVGSRSTKKVEQKRGWMCADWAVRDSAPAWLDWAADFGVQMTEVLRDRTKSDSVRAKASEALAAFEELKVHAIALRQLDELVDIPSKDRAWPVISAAREATWKARRLASAASAASAAYAADAAYAASAASAASAADAASAASAASAADAAYAASAAYVAYAADAASAASAADAASAASAAYVAYAADAAYAASAASAKKRLEEMIKLERVASAQALVRRLVEVRS
jgi:hypothetical protein